MPGYQPRMGTDPVWFNGTNVNTFDKATGLGIWITAINGWDDRPDVRDVRELKFGQDGENADNLYLGGRTITITGSVFGSSWVDLQSRKRALAAVFQPSSTEVLFKVPDPATASPTAVYATTGMTGYERVSCRVVEPIAFGDLIGSVGQTFQLSMRASDPRVYSDVATSTDSTTTGTASRTVTVDQAGTYPTPADLTITGPTASDIAVSDGTTSGLSLAFSNLTLASTSETISINTLARTTTLSSSFSGVRTRKSSLVAGWLLNETSGTVADNYQGTAALDLTYTGGFTLNQTGPGTGLTSVDLNGTTGYVIGTAQAAFAVASFSIEAWVNPDGNSSRYIATSYDAAAARWLLMSSSNKVTLTVGCATSNAASHSAANSLPTGSWTHVVATYDNATGTARVYINGSASVGTTQSIGVGGHTIGTSEKIAIGANANSPASLSFDGKIGPCAFYSAALSASEVADLYTAASAATGLTSNAYTYLSAASSRWSTLPTTSTTYTLSSSGLNTGSKLNVSYRDTRI